MNVRLTLAPVLIAALLALGGCQSGAPRPSAAVRPTKLADSERAKLVIPDDADFAIVEKSAQYHGGAGGTVSAEPSVNPRGEAGASVHAANGGEGVATFQLGHAVSNPLDRQTLLDLTVRLNCDLAIDADPDAGFPDARASLQLVALNRRTRAVRTIPLLNGSSEHGPVRQQGAQTYAAELLLSPGNALDIYLAGEARAAARADHDLTASLNISDVRFEIVSTPAQPLQTAADD